MKKILIFLIFVLLFLTILYADEIFAEKPLQEDKTNKILLKSRQFTPERGISETVKADIKAKFSESTHVLIQLDNIPTNEEKEELEKEGIKLLSYIPNKAWLASVQSDIPNKIIEFPNIKAITEILIEDKISPAVKNKNYIKTNGKVNLSITFFNDVNLDDASLHVEKYGEIVDKYYLINTLKITTEENFVSNIANEEIVQWIDVVDFLPRTYNEGNRENVGVNILQASPYDLSGINIVTAEWDSGWADITHDDLQGRVILGDNATCGAGDSGTCGTSIHSTHVAGTMLGNGILSVDNGGSALQWRGMAPNATVISYEWWDSISELDFEYNDTINNYDASLSQNSWGYTFIGCGSDCFGGYDSGAAALDAVVTGNKGKRISIMWAAGNERPNCDNGQFDCIGLPGTAKNTITVGATNSNDDSMTSFSSFGPTNDGRLKPDVTAPGCQVGGDGGVTSTVPGDSYDTFCGTSMATPTVSGVVALMLEDFASKGIYPLPSTIKVILIHTAKDLGNAGPDYSFGYGRINAKAAVDMIRGDTITNDIIKEDVIATQGETDEFVITVPLGATQLKVSLVWDDFKAAANADPALVNDLDLILIAPNGTQYFSWVLDPINPSNAATTGINTLDNTEQVVVNPQSGVWTVHISGTSIPQAPQKYSIVSNFPFSIVVGVDVTTFKDSFITEDKFFNLNELVYIQANVTAAGTPILSSSVTADLILPNGTVEDSLTLTEVGNGIYRNLWSSSFHSTDVYLINVIATGNETGNGTTTFHLYSGSGVSAYLLDLDEDGKDDNVLENRHIVSVFKRQLNNSPILYYEQKDTNISYSFLTSPYENATSRAGISTDEFPVTLNFSFCSNGENLQTSSMSMELLRVNPGIIDPPLDSSDQVCGVDCNGCTNNDACATPTCRATGGTKAYIDDIRVDAKVVEPNNDITVTIDTVQSFTSDCSAIYYKPPGGSFQEVFCKCPPQFTSETHSVTFNVGNANGLGVIRATMNDGGGSCIVCSTSAGENDGMDITIASVTEESFDFLADVNISVNTEDVDYLIYNLRNFNETIFPDSIFSDIYGTIGSSVNDDRYHLQSGEDNLITSLQINQWNNFTSNYTVIYDNSSFDSVNDNVLAFVRFNESIGIEFQDVGLWNGSEGLRIRYNVTDVTASDEINYILTFTKGDWQNIDQWMSIIQNGQFPSPNFLTSPSAELISITLLGFPVDFSNLDPNSANSSAIGNENDVYIIKIDSITTVNVDIYKKGDNFTSNTDILDIENVVYDDDKVLEGGSDTTNPETILTNSYDVTPYFSNISPGTNKTIYYFISIPGTQKAGEYDTTFFIKAVETGTLP